MNTELKHRIGRAEAFAVLHERKGLTERQLKTLSIDLGIIIKDGGALDSKRPAWAKGIKKEILSGKVKPRKEDEYEQ